MAGKGNLALVETTTGKANGLTRKEIQAKKRLDADLAKRKNIIEEADKISRARTNPDRLIVAMAAKIRYEDEMAELESVRDKIIGFLGEYNSDTAEDEFASFFAAGFKDFQYKCPVDKCDEMGTVKWVLPIGIAVAKALDAKGRTDTLNPKNHGQQWEKGVEMFANPEDLQGYVFCEKHRPAVQQGLERKYPQDHPSNHQLHHIDGFSFQLGRNRHRLLRTDLEKVDNDILECMEDIDKNAESIKALEEKVALERVQEKSIAALI